MKKIRNLAWTPLQKQIYYQAKAGGAVSSIAASLLCRKSTVYLVKAAMEQGFMPPEEVERFSPVHNLLKKKEASKPLRPEPEMETAETICNCGHKVSEHREVGCMHQYSNKNFCLCMKTSIDLGVKPSEPKPLREKNWHNTDPFGGLLVRHEILIEADRAAVEFETAKIRNETARLDLEYAEMKKKLDIKKPAEEAAPAMTLSEVIKLLIINWK